MIKVGFYMSGNYARVLRHCSEYLHEYELYAFCANDKAFKICRTDDRFLNTGYLFDNFNQLYKSLDGTELTNSFPQINLAKVLVTDKNHYKRYSASYQEKIVNTMGVVIMKWLKETSPNYLIFPIIESIDAMLVYEIALQLGIKTMCYSHGRSLQVSFFSNSCNETLPIFTHAIKKDYQREAKKLLKDSIRNERVTFYGANIDKERLDVFEDIEVSHPVSRLFNNIKLKLGKERHNQTLRIWTKFQVYFQNFFVSYHNIKYKAMETLFIKPIINLPEEYDAFPIHFSPESSINTPAPFYIDQERAVDKILISRTGSNRLILKEHPAVLGYRPLKFYLKMKKKPFVDFIAASYDTKKMINGASHIYSVTGTVCLEAFLRGKQWTQLGENFLSEWYKHQTENDKETTPLAFCEDVLKVSGNFFLISPKESGNSNDMLMSKENISNMCNNINSYIENTQL